MLFRSGKVSWNIDEHSLTYIAGTLPVYNNIYVLANGKVTLSITEADDVLQVLALDDVARDVRGGVIHNYPLVKIGTQYWMRNNLEAALFANGDEIPKLEGGFIFEIGTYRLDASVANQIKRVKQQFIAKNRRIV